MRTLFVLLFLLSACGGLETAPHGEMASRDLDQYHTGMGSIQYFLTDLPEWANFSTAGQCQRGISVRYLDYEKVSRSYGLDYRKLVQLQGMFNQRLEEQRRLAHLRLLMPKDEEFWFSDSLDRIQGGVSALIVPDYARVHLVWIDPILREKDGMAQLTKLMRSTLMASGHPVWMSMCRSRAQLDELLTQSHMNDKNIRVIGAEMFSPYTSEMKMGVHFQLVLDALFRPEQELHFFSVDEIVPDEIVGHMTVHSI